MAEHGDVAGADADAGAVGGVGEEGGERREHRRAQLADAGRRAALRAAVERGPSRSAVPAEGGLGGRYTRRVRRCRQGRTPGILMQIQDRVEAAAGEEADGGAHLLEVGVVVLAGRRLHARPRQQQAHGVPADRRHLVRVRLAEREDRGQSPYGQYSARALTFTPRSSTSRPSASTMRPPFATSGSACRSGRRSSGSVAVAVGLHVALALAVALGDGEWLGVGVALRVTVRLAVIVGVRVWGAVAVALAGMVAVGAAVG